MAQAEACACLADEYSVQRLFSQIMRAAYCLNFTSLERERLHPGQPPVLYELYREENLSQRELADRLMIRPSTLTVMLKRLEGNGLIERHPDRCYQRVLRVSLTQAGREKYRRLIAVRAHLENVSLRSFSAEEIAQLKQMLIQVRDNLIHAAQQEKEDDAHA